MAIGYACITLGLPQTRLRSLTKKTANDESLAEVIDHNLTVLDTVLDYCDDRAIRLFRISSDIIPFGSSPVNTVPWQDIFAEKLAALGTKAQRYGIRLSMHPGQYTVLNSPDEGVVERAVADLAYHNDFLDALGIDASNKSILHIGGVYGDKPTAMKRFVSAYGTLSEAIKARLIIENDDRLYTATDALALSEATGAPMVFDVLHHELNREPGSPDTIELIDRAATTWKPRDGKPKIHYSQQAEGRKPGSHSDTIAIDPFLAFHRSLGARTDALDIMLEVKDKDLSAVKCIACLDPRGTIKTLEQEWARYKYTVLEHDAAIYQRIRTLLKDKQAYPAVEFYHLVEQALATSPEPGSFRNAVQHVWGYVSKLVDPRERASFDRLMERYESGSSSGEAVKKRLATLAAKYEQDYLLSSYYFVL